MWHVAFLTSCQMKDPVFPWTVFLYPMCLPCTYLFHSLLGSFLSQGKHVLGFCCTRLPRESTIPLENGLALSFHPWLLVVYLQPGYIGSTFTVWTLFHVWFLSTSHIISRRKFPLESFQLLFIQMITLCGLTETLLKLPSSAACLWLVKVRVRKINHCSLIGVKSG